MTVDDHLRAIEAWLGAPLAPTLARLIPRFGEDASGRFSLYAADEIIERNETYETKIYCPGWLVIGDDGGGRAVVVSPRLEPTTVYLVDHGSMDPETFEIIAEDLCAWASAGCAA